MIPLQGRLLAALGLVVVALVGCQALSSGGAPSGAADPRLRRILREGELRVGLTADLPPLGLRDKRGEIVGFEVDVARALADAMGVQVRFVVQPFPRLLPALESDEVDLVISGVTITAERNARVAFAGPYYVSGTSLVGVDAAIAEMRDASAFDRADARLAALEDSTSARFVREHLPNAELLAVTSYEEGERLLRTGGADAMVADHLACKMAVWRNEEVGLFTLPYPFTVEPLGIALPADAPLLLNLVQNYLRTLENTGLLSTFKARWLVDSSWMARLQ